MQQKDEQCFEGILLELHKKKKKYDDVMNEIRDKGKFLFIN